MIDTYNNVKSPRYASFLGCILDQISFFLLYPWASLLSIVISFYWTTSQPQSFFASFVERWIAGPILALFILGLLPLGLTGRNNVHRTRAIDKITYIIGIAIWIFLCTFFQQKKYSYLHLPNAKNHTTTKQVFTITSANVLLGNELFSRINNHRNTLSRAKSIGQRLATQSEDTLENLTGRIPPRIESCITTHLPDVDILVLQEVWERYWAATLIDYLQSKYSHFVYDIGEFNLLSNFCLFGSGLFIASKYPIEAVDFQSFQYKIKYARMFSYGVVSVKIRLDNSRVAYVSNLHGQAYQGKDAVLFHQMSETLDSVNRFRMKTKKKMDVVVFDTLCGDFNFDNMSPGDAATQNHPILNQYMDVCTVKPGVDHPWAIGTELRQRRMHEPRVSTPESFRQVLLDDVLRRYYVLDADVEEHTLALASVDPAPNKEGEVTAEPWGGKRRIDRILIRNDCRAKVKGYGFSTVLCGLTDHIPVCLSLKINE